MQGKDDGNGMHQSTIILWMIGVAFVAWILSGAAGGSDDDAGYSDGRAEYIPEPNHP